MHHVDTCAPHKIKNKSDQYDLLRIRWSKMVVSFTKKNMKTLIKEIFQEEFKEQAENITDLISGNFKLTMQEVHGLKSEINDLRKSLKFT